MPGPMPKDAAIKRRRNKSSTKASLPAPVGIRPVEQKPRLPNCPNDGNWHAMSKRWWTDVWSSPMAYEFLEGDLPALFRLVVLVDKFWKTGDLDHAREIRLMEREFGLTPLSRRRLEWSVVQAEESKSKFENKRFQRAQMIDSDPRDILSK